MTIKQIDQPNPSDVIDATKRDVKTTINCVQIGIIQSFNPSKQTAKIRLCLKKVNEIKPDGTRIIVEHPLLVDCPVMTNFGGSAFINLPIQAGDNCIVLFNDREIDNWLFDGGVQTPQTGRVHDLSDAIAIVGIRNYQNAISNFLTDGIRLWFNSNTKIDIKDDVINSLADLWTHTGNMRIMGNFTVEGNGGADTATINCNLTQLSGKVLKAGNGATGTFGTVYVSDGIVTGGL